MLLTVVGRGVEGKIVRKFFFELTRRSLLFRNKKLGTVFHVPHLIDSGWSDELLQWSGHVAGEKRRCPMPAVALMIRVFGKKSNRRYENNIEPYVGKQDGR
jgi:hypothetical protein